MGELTQHDDISSPQDILTIIENAHSKQLNDREYALSLANHALELAQELYPNNLELQAHAQVVIAIAYYGQGKYSEAVSLLLSLVEIYNHAPPSKWTLLVYHYLGVIYVQIGLYSNALESHLFEYQIAETIDDQSMMASALRRAGVAHLRLEQYDRALHYYQRAASYYQALNDVGGLASIYNNIASLLNHQKEYTQAIEMALKGIAGFEEVENYRGLAFIHANIADAYLELGQVEKALLYATRSTEYAKQSQHAKIMTSVMAALGKALLHTDRIDEALNISHDMLKKAEDMGDYRNEIGACKLLCDCYERIGDYEKALSYHKRLYEKDIGATKQAINTRFEYLEIIHQTQEAWQEAKLQAELRKQEKEHYQNLAQMKEEFVASLSHDLKNPLSIALLALNGLRRVIVDNEKGLTYITRLDAAMKQMQYLIVEVLELAQLQMGHPLKLDYQAISPIIKNAVYTHQIHAETKDIKLSFHNSNIEHIQTYFDKIQLRRVLDNLLSNAIKYTAKGGEVRVGSILSEEEITIYVRDTGPGIPADQFEHIFKHFARLKTGPQADEVGTGLGLCAVKAIIEQHGGTVSVESEVGVGSTFSVHLPLIDEVNTL